MTTFDSTIRLAAIAALAGIAGVAPVTAEPRFDTRPVEACLASTMDRAARERCIGLAANACMESDPAGQTTVGMGFCADRERAYWDARLNAVYGQVMAKHKATDAEMKALGSAAPSLAEALRAMQRAWIPFRDAACDYERAQWGGGTGGGPATLFCLLDMTAAQTLELEARLANDAP